jgi:F0F1-type ATP synthase alpha subunit
MQQLNPSEISALIKQRIGDLDTSATAKNEGTIVMVSDGIVRIHGLADAMYGEMIEFDGGLYGMALNLEQDSVGVVVLGNYLSLQEDPRLRTYEFEVVEPILVDVQQLQGSDRLKDQNQSQYLKHQKRSR